MTVIPVKMMTVVLPVIKDTSIGDLSFQQTLCIKNYSATKICINLGVDSSELNVKIRNIELEQIVVSMIYVLQIRSIALFL